MARRIAIVAVCAIVATAVIIGCSDQMKPERPLGNLLSKLGMNGVEMPPNPLGGRPNPLIDYIRTNWTGGDTIKTSGLHYSHIKVYGYCWKDLYGNGWDPDGAQAEFIADHFDMYTWGGYNVAEHAYPQYPSFLWLVLVGSNCISSVWDSMETTAWINSAANEDSITWDDLVMHYKYDNTMAYGPFKGWNPSDDTDGDGCIEPGEGNNGQPSDSTRTAQCIANAEVKNDFYRSSRLWNWAELSSAMVRGYEGYLDMRSDRAANEWSSYAKPFKGCFIDNIAFNDYTDWGLDHTFSYEDPSYVESNRQYYVDKIAWVPAFANAMNDKAAEQLTVYIGNTVSPYYSCGDWNQSGKEWMKGYLENCFDECWLETGGSQPLTVDKIPCWLNCPFLDYCEQGKGYIFSAKSFHNSDRERRFTLATFYMVNHQMAFFYFRTRDHDPEQNDKVWDWQWNPYVPFDVGQPIVNTLGKLDFQGDSGTNRYFVFAQGSSYKVLGREYMRADGKKVLVLTKIMASGCAEGQDPMNVALPRCYQAVLPDLTLGSAVDVVTLYNNDGVILVEATCPPPPPPGGGKDPEPVDP